MRHKAICYVCGGSIERDKGFDLDHAIPLRIGGKDNKANLRPLHKSCHIAKTKSDQALIGKTRRQEAKSWGVKTPKGKPIRSRGFDKSSSASRKKPALKMAGLFPVSPFISRTKAMSEPSRDLIEAALADMGR